MVGFNATMKSFDSRSHHRSGQSKFLSRSFTGAKRRLSRRLPISWTTAAPLDDPTEQVVEARKWHMMTSLDRIVLRLAESWVFKIFMNCIIITSCVLVGISVDAQKYGLNEDDPVFQVTENIFLVLFIIEYVVNCFAHGVPFATSVWGLLDLVILLAGIISVWIFGVVALVSKDDPLKTDFTFNSSSFASFRVLRLFQVVRTVRLSAKFKMLWSLVRGMVSAIKALLWTFFLMVVLFYLFAILGVEIVGKNEFLKTYHDQHVVELVETKFGGVLNAMLSSLQIATLDSWNSEIASNIIHAAAEDSEHQWRCAVIAVYFVSLVAMGGLVLMNLVTAVIVEQSLEGSQQDSEAIAAWERNELQMIIASLEEAFKCADADEDNELSWAELESAYADTTSKMHPFLTQLGSLDEIKQMFTMLDVDENRCLAMKEFAKGIQRYKDDSNKFMMWQIWKKQRNLFERLEAVLPRVSSSPRAAKSLQHPPHAASSGQDSTPAF